MWIALQICSVFFFFFFLIFTFTYVYIYIHICFMYIRFTFTLQWQQLWLVHLYIYIFVILIIVRLSFPSKRHFPLVSLFSPFYSNDRFTVSLCYFIHSKTGIRAVHQVSPPLLYIYTLYIHVSFTYTFTCTRIFKPKIATSISIRILDSIFRDRSATAGRKLAKSSLRDSSKS